jgi:hypothetical protein
VRYSQTIPRRRGRCSSNREVIRPSRYTPECNGRSDRVPGSWRREYVGGLGGRPKQENARGASEGVSAAGMNVWASVWAPPGFLRTRVGTCCLLIKCKRAASLSLGSPPTTAAKLREPPRLPYSAAVTKPRPDNNEIHKSVRERSAHPASGSLSLCPSPSLSLSPSVSCFLSSEHPAPPIRAPVAFPRCRAVAFVTLDRVLLRVEASLRFPPFAGAVLRMYASWDSVAVL